MITIQKVNLSEIEQLQQLSYETFKETFSPYNTTENMTIYLKKAFNLPKLQKELNNADSHFFFIYYNKLLAGYLKINLNTAQSENMGPESLEIERIYIKKAFQRKGLGQILLNKALELGKDFHKKQIWLGVWTENNKALNFYRKNHFVETTTHTFKLGNKKQTDYLMIHQVL